jgi:hypothetical protein
MPAITPYGAVNLLNFDLRGDTSKAAREWWVGIAADPPNRTAY